MTLHLWDDSMYAISTKSLLTSRRQIGYLLFVIFFNYIHYVYNMQVIKCCLTFVILYVYCKLYSEFKASPIMYTQSTIFLVATIIMCNFADMLALILQFCIIMSVHFCKHGYFQHLWAMLVW